MENIVIMEQSPEIEELSKKLGFTKTLFLHQDVIFLKGENRKELLTKAQEAKRKKKIVFFQPSSEAMLRFATESLPVDFLFGVENIHPEDTFHYVRGGMDQVLCKLAVEHKKSIAFSLQRIIDASPAIRAKMLGRIIFTIRVCRKYDVKMLLSNFSEDNMSMRSAKDLDAFWRVLNK